MRPDTRVDCYLVICSLQHCRLDCLLSVSDGDVLAMTLGRLPGARASRASVSFLTTRGAQLRLCGHIREDAGRRPG